MISAVILAKANENLEKCLKSVKWCDEIIFICDESIKIQNSKLKNQSYKFKIKTFERELGGNFAEQRNFAMEKVKGDWILFVDADEEMTDKLKEEILRLTTFAQNDKMVYSLKRRDFFWGREMKWGEIRKAREQGIVRLVKKGSGKWLGKVHEEFRVQNSEFRIKTLINFINHYPHQTVKEFIEKINFYSSLRAQELFLKKRKTNIFEIIFLPMGKFIYTYFILLGFLDGVAGFVYSFMMSFHSFLVRIKLFQLSEKGLNVKIIKK